jgi:hypothetical protein
LFIAKLELGAIADDSWLNGNRSLLRSPYIAAQHGSGVLIAFDSDADRDVGLETEALFAEFTTKYQKAG